MVMEIFQQGGFLWNFLNKANFWEYFQQRGIHFVENFATKQGKFLWIFSHKKFETRRESCDKTAWIFMKISKKSKFPCIYAATLQEFLWLHTHTFTTHTTCLRHTRDAVLVYELWSFSNIDISLNTWLLAIYIDCIYLHLIYKIYQ